MSPKIRYVDAGLTSAVGASTTDALSIGVIGACLAAFISGCTALRIGGISPYDPLIIFVLFVLALEAAVVRRSVFVPRWIVAIAVAFAATLAIDVVFLRVPAVITYTRVTFVVGSSLGDSTGGPAPLVGRVFLALVVTGLVVSFVPPKWLGLLIRCWTSGIVLSCAVSLMQFALGGFDLPFVYHIASTRGTGLANNPNSLGESAVLGLGACLLFSCGPTSRKARVVLLAAAAACIGGAVSSESRAALIVGAATAVILSLYGAGRVSPALALIAVLVESCGSVLFASPLLSTSRFGGSAGAASDQARSSALNSGWNVFSSHPLLGAGLGTWFGENVYLVVLAGGGIILTAALAISFSVPVASFIANRNAQRLISMFGLVSVAILLAFNLLNNALFERYQYWPILLAGAYLSHNAARPETNAGVPAPVGSLA